MSDEIPPPRADPQEVTLHLRALEEGDQSAIERLLPHIYADLRAVAGQLFRGQRVEHTLQPTALVHEAYVRLAKPHASGFKSRQHFLNVAAMAMRQLLTDYARARDAQKRAGGRERVSLDELDEVGGAGQELDIGRLDEALDKLQRLDARQARIVELRFLAGLTVEETAEVLEVSVQTVYLDWKMARGWLQRELES